MGLAGLMTMSSLNPVNLTDSALLALTDPTPVSAQVLSEDSKEPHEAQTLRDLIADKATEAGVDKGLALKIAFCESTYRQFDNDGKPLRGVHNKDDVGVFQINEKFHLAKSQELGYDIYSTEGNIDYAVWVLKHQGSKAWVWSRPCWDK